MEKLNLCRTKSRRRRRLYWRRRRSWVRRRPCGKLRWWRQELMRLRYGY